MIMILEYTNGIENGLRFFTIYNKNFCKKSYKLIKIVASIPEAQSLIYRSWDAYL